MTDCEWVSICLLYINITKYPAIILFKKYCTCTLNIICPGKRPESNGVFSVLWCEATPIWKAVTNAEDTFNISQYCTWCVGRLLAIPRHCLQNNTTQYNHSLERVLPARQNALLRLNYVVTRLKAKAFYFKFTSVPRWTKDTLVSGLSYSLQSICFKHSTLNPFSVLNSRRTWLEIVRFYGVLWNSSVYHRHTHTTLLIDM